jgi:lactoylglutathione lyase
MKILHTMIRVADLEASIDFYTECLDMTLKKRKEYPDGEFTLAFVGYEGGASIELTYNWGVDEPYEKGDGFGHIALEVEDIEATCERVRDYGASVTREPGPMKHGSTVMAFIEDPDGYQIELIEKGTQDV